MLSLNLEEHARAETTETMLGWYPNSICVIDEIACLWTIWMKVWLCVLTISASAVKLCCVDNFCIGSDLVVVNDFWVSYEPCTLMILASAVKLSCIYDFWVGSDSIFINDFWVSCEPCTLTIFESTATQFSSTISELAVNHVHWQFQRQLWNCVELTIFESAAT